MFSSFSKRHKNQQIETKPKYWLHEIGKKPSIKTNFPFREEVASEKRIHIPAFSKREKPSHSTLPILGDMEKLCC